MKPIASPRTQPAAPSAGQSRSWSQVKAAVVDHSLVTLANCPNRNNYNEYCLRFVKQIFKDLHAPIAALEAPCPSAIIARLQAVPQMVHAWEPGNPPPQGAIVLWGANAANGFFGHVAVSLGGNQVASAAWPGFKGGKADIAWVNSQENRQKPFGWVLPEALAALPAPGGHRLAASSRLGHDVFVRSRA